MALIPITSLFVTHLACGMFDCHRHHRTFDFLLGTIYNDISEHCHHRQSTASSSAARPGCPVDLSPAQFDDGSFKCPPHDPRIMGNNTG